jgi:hypothetical protein
MLGGYEDFLRMVIGQAGAAKLASPVDAEARALLTF